MPHVRPGFQYGAQVLLPSQVPVYEIGKGLALGHRAVSVAKLPVIVHFKAGAHAVTAEGKGVDDGIGVLDLLAQEPVEAVMIDAFARGRAVEAAEAAALEGEVREIYKARAIGKGGGKILDEGAQALVPLPQIAHDHGIKAVQLFDRLQRADIGCALRHSGWRGSMLINGILRAEDGIAEKLRELRSPLLGEHVLHVRREAVDHASAEIMQVFLQETVGRHVEEVLGGGQGRRILVLEGNPPLPHEFQKAVQL